MEKSLKTGKSLISLLKGVLMAVSCSLIGVFIFAFIYKFVSINDITTIIINQIIKVVSIILGCLVSFKNDKTRGLFKGTIIGILYTLISYFVFSLIASNFSFSLSFVYDLVFSAIIGIISGIIIVNLKK